MTNTILVVGSLNMDVVMSVATLPNRGQTLTIKQIDHYPGGKGGNQAMAASLLGADVKFIGCVGEDKAGRQLIESLREAKVDVSSIVVDKGVQTGTAYITVEESGENTICVFPGANGSLSREMVETRLNSRKPAAIVASLEIPLDPVATILEWGKKNGIITVLNPAPARKLSKDIYANSDYLIPNETELALLSEMEIKSVDDVQKGCRRLLEQGVKAVVVTLGDQGAYFCSANEEFYEPAVQVDMVDATGAGDAFVAAFTQQIVQGISVKDAIRFASLTGAKTVTKPGAQSALPTLEEVRKFASRMISG